MEVKLLFPDYYRNKTGGMRQLSDLTRPVRNTGSNLDNFARNI